MGQESSGTAAFQGVEDSVEDVAQGGSARPPRRLRGREIDFQASSFLVGEIGRIGPFHARERTRSFQPSVLPNTLLEPSTYSVSVGSPLRAKVLC